jgi:hypothetical protein
MCVKQSAATQRALEASEERLREAEVLLLYSLY